MKTKYGFVVLVDALGTKTSTIESSAHYLKTIDEIKKEIKAYHSGVTSDAADKGIDPKIFNDLSIRFFGDTILMTYQVKNRNHEFEYYAQISIMLNLFISSALGKELLFRGSLALAVC